MMQRCSMLQTLSLPRFAEVGIYLVDFLVSSSGYLLGMRDPYFCHTLWLRLQLVRFIRIHLLRTRESFWNS